MGLIPDWALIRNIGIHGNSVTINRNINYRKILFIIRIIIIHNQYRMCGEMLHNNFSTKHTKVLHSDHERHTVQNTAHIMVLYTS